MFRPTRTVLAGGAAASLAIAAIAYAGVASGDQGADDVPARTAVSTPSATGGAMSDPTPSSDPTSSSSPTSADPSASPSASFDDHGGDRPRGFSDDGPRHDLGDDHGGDRDGGDRDGGHGSDD